MKARFKLNNIDTDCSYLCDENKVKEIHCDYYESRGTSNELISLDCNECDNKKAK